MVAAGSVASRRGHATPLIDRPSSPAFPLFRRSARYYYPGPRGCTDQRRLTLPNLCTPCVQKEEEEEGALIVISNDSRGNDDGIAFAARVRFSPILRPVCTLVGCFFRVSLD